MNNFLRVLNGVKADKPPVWFMRQAGRYLPEYRALRETADDFMQCVMTPELAIDITMQPLRRFPLLDAAILFSDILVIPHALGQRVDIIKGEGVQLGELPSALTYDKEKLAPILKTVSGVRAELRPDQTMIGFAGAPWTIACYMISGNSKDDFSAAKHWAFNHPEKLDALIDTVTTATIDYLCDQIDAGAQVIQIFESWAGALAGHRDAFERFIINPTRRIVDAIRLHNNTIPVIGFPRCSGSYLPWFTQSTGINAVGLGWDVDLEWAHSVLPKDFPVQGNLDPVILLNGGEAMKRKARFIIDTLSDRPFVFNLGHGVIRFTPPEHVQELLEIIKS